MVQVSELGGVPVLITPTDMTNTIPDEKVTATFIGYLAVRLLDLSRFVVLSLTSVFFTYCLQGNQSRKNYPTCLEENFCPKEGRKDEGDVFKVLSWCFDFVKMTNQ